MADRWWPAPAARLRRAILTNRPNRQNSRETRIPRASLFLSVQHRRLLYPDLRMLANSRTLMTSLESRVCGPQAGSCRTSSHLLKIILVSKGVHSPRVINVRTLREGKDVVYNVILFAKL